jgi:glycosyltransferase involved in cell wall biosynthesis
LLEWKGLAVALQAVSAIHQHYPGLRFVIAGQGPARTRLEKLSHQLGLANVVEWAGWRTQADLAQHYRAADLLLFPSMRDSGGMVVLEALAHGLPVLCTDLGGPGLIVNDTCGRAVATRGLNQAQLVGKFAQALREVLDAPDRMASLSTWASARARQFNFRNLARLVHPPPALRSRARQV